MKFASPLVCAILVSVALPALAPATAGPSTVLDQETGSTLTISARPWLFARDEPSLAANARDYVALHAVEIDTAGKREYFLVVFFWSSIDRRGDFAGATPRMELAIDDRQVSLTPDPRTPRDLGISHWPLSSPGKGARLFVYRADTTLIRQLAQSRYASLKLLDDMDGDDEPIATWRDGRSAFKDFVAKVSE
jgi:hypothetical protein